MAASVTCYSLLLLTAVSGLAAQICIETMCPITLDVADYSPTDPYAMYCRAYKSAKDCATRNGCTLHDNSLACTTCALDYMCGDGRQAKIDHGDCLSNISGMLRLCPFLPDLNNSSFICSSIDNNLRCAEAAASPCGDEAARFQLTHTSKLLTPYIDAYSCTPYGSDPVDTAADSDPVTTTADSGPIATTADSGPIATTAGSDPVATTPDSEPIATTSGSDPVATTAGSVSATALTPWHWANVGIAVLLAVRL